MTDGVNREFLNTLLASNLIWACVTFVVTGLVGAGALLWRKRANKKAVATHEAEWCRHCEICRGWVGGTGKKCMITREVCAGCRSDLDHRPGEMRAHRAQRSRRP